MTEADAYSYGFWIFLAVCLVWGASNLWDRLHK